MSTTYTGACESAPTPPAGAPGGPVLLALDNVSFSYIRPKRYRDLFLRPLRGPVTAQALERVSLVVRAGEKLAVVGRNGAGKTTLLKLIGGLLYPTHGTVSVCGANSVHDGSFVRRRVGYVINEERSFYWRLTGAQNLEFFGALNDLFGARARARIRELLSQVGLERAADRRVSDYSAGMKQRLALARGLLFDPDILLLDEPTKSLDPIGADSIRQLILCVMKSGRERKRALVITTNQMGDVAELCDRFCIVSDHRKVLDQPVPSGTASISALVHRFLQERQDHERCAQVASIY